VNFVELYSIMHKYLILFILVILTTISCKKETKISHIVEDKTIRVGDTNYYYSLALPYDYNENDSYPVFVALHWGGYTDFQSGANFLSTFALEALKDFKGFIISPSCPEAAGWIHENSEALVLGLVERIKNDYNIDENKFIVGGYSMGGIGTWYYGSVHSDIFKVAVPIASSPPNYLAITDIVPTYAIHGTDDEVFSIQKVKEVVRNIKINGNIIRFTEIEGASHYETNKYIDPLAESVEWVESYLE